MVGAEGITEDGRSAGGRLASTTPPSTPSHCRLQSADAGRYHQRGIVVFSLLLDATTADQAMEALEL